MARLFPGVDPYIEAQHDWPDFHARFINYWCEAIAGALPRGYSAKMDERINLVERAEPVRIARPDVAVLRRTETLSEGRPAATAVLSPSVILPVMILEEQREVFIRILHRADRRLVCVLELLSPSNKFGSGRGEYLAKRNALLRDSVHLVELDLLTGGERVPMGEPLPPGDFYAIVARGDRRPESEVYPWSLRQPLPTIAIPLLAPDPDIAVDLDNVYSTAFERGRYSEELDYAAPLGLPIPSPERTWAESVARGGGA